LKPKFEIDNYNGSFLSAMLETEKFRYNFGNSVKLENLENTRIFLPSVDKEDKNKKIDDIRKIDWQRIEEIVKKIDKAELLDVKVVR